MLLHCCIEMNQIRNLGLQWTIQDDALQDTGCRDGSNLTRFRGMNIKENRYQMMLKKRGTRFPSPDSSQSESESNCFATQMELHPGNEGRNMSIFREKYVCESHLHVQVFLFSFFFKALFFHKNAQNAYYIYIYT